MGRSATLRRDRQQARQANPQMPTPWKNAKDYEQISFEQWALAMNVRWGRGIIVYYFDKMPTCYLMPGYVDLGTAENLMAGSYDPLTQVVISVPSMQPEKATPQSYSSMPFFTRIADLNELDTQIIVPKCDHTHPGLVFR